jgi:probable rRNA maturation factor
MKKIFVTNIHLQLKINLKKMEKLVVKILKKERVTKCRGTLQRALTMTNQRRSNVNIILIDDKFMRRLNRKFTKRAGTTDVLSFEMSERLHSKKEDENLFKEFADPEDVLGEIYINLDQAKKNAQNHQVKFTDEVALLVTHGVLHLLGYDHKKKYDFLVMREKEKEYLSQRGRLRSRSASGGTGALSGRA